jgi:hypothetical protein
MVKTAPCVFLILSTNMPQALPSVTVAMIVGVVFVSWFTVLPSG